MGGGEREAIEAFKRDVIDPSMDALVILDFWAEWCGPCKALAPVLEKVTAEFAPRVKLAKINVDENRTIAAQFRVQSIPTVYAIFQGQPVYDLTPARTERELRHYLEQLLKQLPVPEAAGDQAADIEPLIQMGNEVLGSGDAARAEGIFRQIVEIAPDNPAAVAGLAQALLALGRTDEAEAALAGLPEDKAGDPAIAKAKAGIALAKDAAPVDDFDALLAEVAASPDDHEKRFALAAGHVARGDRDAAADALLEIIRRDRAWNEGAARDRLLKLFEAVGLDDPWTLGQRRKLSAILFS
nr:tetratricopeptide repeat protein [Tardibacter chloracetimidivorans]